MSKKIEHEPSWRLKLNEQRTLRKEGAGLLYDRVKLLIDCYNDQDFRDWCDSEGTTDVDYLDAELADVAMDFLTLKAVFEEYPRRTDWQRLKIRELAAQIIDSRRTKSHDRTVPSWKARALKAEAEAESLRRENAKLREAIEDMGGKVVLVGAA